MNGFAPVRPEGARRIYAVEPEPLQDVDRWLDRFRRSWDQHLAALATELVRGQRNDGRTARARPRWDRTR